MVSGIIIIITLFLLESMLSVDNAAVLAVLVNELPNTQRPKALRYGILGAFILRGGSLFLASYLTNIWWLKLLGGIYLLVLYIKHANAKNKQSEDPQALKKSFWHTVMMVELMDMSFSVDNILAAVAITQNIWFIYAGVFMGIIAMRFVAQWFNKIMQKFPSMEDSAFFVILLLGLKQVVFTIIREKVQETETMDIIFSGIMIFVFFIPILKDYGRKINS